MQNPSLNQPKPVGKRKTAASLTYDGWTAYCRPLAGVYNKRVIFQIYRSKEKNPSPKPMSKRTLKGIVYPFAL